MSKIYSTVLALIVVSIPYPALAHHPIGGDTPVNAWQGLLSGIGHPIIGLDHLAFIVGIGLFAAMKPTRILLPLLFVLASIAGTLMFAAGVTLSFTEVLISASVLLVGALLVYNRSNASWHAPLLVCIGLLHGLAYGGAIIGSEVTPLLAYLLGLAVVQCAVAYLIVLAVRLKNISSESVQFRLAGAVIGGIGVTYLVEIFETTVIGV